MRSVFDLPSRIKLIQFLQEWWLKIRHGPHGLSWYLMWLERNRLLFLASNDYDDFVSNTKNLSIAINITKASPKFHWLDFQILMRASCYSDLAEGDYSQEKITTATGFIVLLMLYHIHIIPRYETMTIYIRMYTNLVW